MRFLSENLRGVDIHPTACLVTCFSLYLAFLDQMEPKEIMELREALEQDTKEKLLPRILWEQGKPRPRPPQMDSIRELDFFELPTKPEFDLVIGNPPWVSRKERTFSRGMAVLGEAEPGGHRPQEVGTGPDIVPRQGIGLRVHVEGGTASTQRRSCLPSVAIAGVSQ